MRGRIIALLMLPWQNTVLKNWSIVGMNHYHIKGKKYLFVSLARKGYCVTEEGLDNPALWKRLFIKVQKMEKEKGLSETLLVRP